jgi:uncharacterized protein (DUF362 family)
MTARKTRVALIEGCSRRMNAYNALDAVRDVLVPKLASTVLIKPNFLTSTNQLASTHVDAVRGVIDFLMSVDKPPEEIIIAEGGNEAFSGEAFMVFGYRSLNEEYDVSIRLVDLNQEKAWRKETVHLVGDETATVRMPVSVLDCPCTISLAIAKTHDNCIVTLALKNMIMGSICKEDRIHIHGYRAHKDRHLPDEVRLININMARMARHLMPDIAVIDGVVGLEGNGPMSKESVDFGVTAAGADALAVDAVMSAAMGFDPCDIAHIQYAAGLGLGIADLDQIETVGANIADVLHPFKPHETIETQKEWHREDAERFMA